MPLASPAAVSFNLLSSSADFLDDSFLHLLLLILANLFPSLHALASPLSISLLLGVWIGSGRQVYLSDNINLETNSADASEDFFRLLSPLFQPVLLQLPVREQALYHFFLFRLLLSLYNRAGSSLTTVVAAVPKRAAARAQMPAVPPVATVVPVGKQGAGSGFGVSTTAGSSTFFSSTAFSASSLPEQE